MPSRTKSHSKARKTSAPKSHVASAKAGASGKNTTSPVTSATSTKPQAPAEPVAEVGQGGVTGGGEEEPGGVGGGAAEEAPARPEWVDDALLRRMRRVRPETRALSDAEITRRLEAKAQGLAEKWLLSPPKPPPGFHLDVAKAAIHATSKATEELLKLRLHDPSPGPADVPEPGWEEFDRLYKEIMARPTLLPKATPTNSASAPGASSESANGPAPDQPLQDPPLEREEPGQGQAVRNLGLTQKDSEAAALSQTSVPVRDPWEDSFAEDVPPAAEGPMDLEDEKRLIRRVMSQSLDEATHLPDPDKPDEPSWLQTPAPPGPADELDPADEEGPADDLHDGLSDLAQWDLDALFPGRTEDAGEGQAPVVHGAGLNAHIPGYLPTPVPKSLPPTPKAPLLRTSFTPAPKLWTPAADTKAPRVAMARGRQGPELSAAEKASRTPLRSSTLVPLGDYLAGRTKNLHQTKGKPHEDTGRQAKLDNWLQPKKRSKGSKGSKGGAATTKQLHSSDKADAALAQVAKMDVTGTEGHKKSRSKGKRKGSEGKGTSGGRAEKPEAPPTAEQLCPQPVTTPRAEVASSKRRAVPSAPKVAKRAEVWVKQEAEEGEWAGLSGAAEEQLWASPTVPIPLPLKTSGSEGEAQPHGPLRSLIDVKLEEKVAEQERQKAQPPPQAKPKASKRRRGPPPNPAVGARRSTRIVARVQSSDNDEAQDPGPPAPPASPKSPSHPRVPDQAPLHHPPLQAPLPELVKESLASTSGSAPTSRIPTAKDGAAVPGSGQTPEETGEEAAVEAGAVETGAVEPDVDKAAAGTSGWDTVSTSASERSASQQPGPGKKSCMKSQDDCRSASSQPKSVRFHYSVKSHDVPYRSRPVPRLRKGHRSKDGSGKTARRPRPPQGPFPPTDSERTGESHAAVEAWLANLPPHAALPADAPDPEVPDDALLGLSPPPTPAQPLTDLPPPAVPPAQQPSSKAKSPKTKRSKKP